MATLMGRVVALSLMAGAAHAAVLHVGAVPAVVAAHGVARLGDVDPAGVMEVSVSLPMRDAAGLDRLLQALYERGSPQYHRFLSVSEYTERFGPSAADYAAASGYFAAQGLAVRADAANRAMIQLSGRVGDMERAFHVTLGRYRHPSENRSFVAPDVEPTLDLAVPVSEVIGLDDYVRPTPRLIRPGAVLTTVRATGSGPHGEFIGSDMRAAYYGGTLTGTGQSLGLMELVGYNIASVNTYFANVKQTRSVPVVTVATDEVNPSCTGKCDDGEQALDIDYAISMAPGMAQLEVYVGNAEDVLNSMASKDTSRQLSTSWGWSEKFATDDALFKEMAAQGQSFLTASGDNSSLKASGPWPEEDANLTAVGGTDLVTAGAAGAWSSETGWNGSAGGPSVDKTIGIEAYQTPYVTAANKGSKTLRNVPDVAAQANINMYYCSNSGCSYAGGTSFASPMWAGFVALANQQAKTLGHAAVGFLNPTVYGIGKSGNVGTLLHDQTRGTSGKYTCTPSFDLVTGLGSMQAGLIGVLAGQ